MSENESKHYVLNKLHVLRTYNTLRRTINEVLQLPQKDERQKYPEMCIIMNNVSA